MQLSRALPALPSTPPHGCAIGIQVNPVETPRVEAFHIIDEINLCALGLSWMAEINAQVSKATLTHHLAIL